MTIFRRAFARTAFAAAAVAALGLGAAGAAPAASAATTTIAVSTASQLKSALYAVKPGQTIALADGVYTGTFSSSVNGTSTAPITLIGSRKAVITTGSTGSGTALLVKGDHWRLTGFRVTTAQKGIMLHGSDYTIVSSLDVGSIGHEAVHVRASSVGVIIRTSSIHDTGLTNAGYGEGVYVGSAQSNWSSIMGSATTPDRSDRVIIEDNAIANTSAEGVDIKEGTTGGIVRRNVFTRAGYSGANYADSWVDVKGDGYRIESNSGSTARLDAFQVHSVLAGWGGDNVFSGNAIVSGVPGYEVRVESRESGNRVSCTTSNAALGLTNIHCG